MSLNTFRFVKFDSKYRDDVVQLQAHLWGDDLDANARYLTWKYDENPYLNEKLIFLALHSDRVVGMRGISGAKWQYGTSEHSVVIPCAGDTVIDPEYRRQGLLGKIFNAMMTDPTVAKFPYLLNFSAREPIYYRQIRDGWRVIAAYDTESHTMALRKSPRTRLLRRIARNIVSDSLREKIFEHLGRSGHVGTDNIHVEVSNTARPGDMAILAERMRHRGKFRHVADHDFFAWRFRSPLATYRFFYWQGAALDGFLVVAKGVNSAEPDNIVAWEAISSCVLDDLLQAAINEARFAGIAIWTATLSNSVRDLLHNSGFTAVDDSGTDSEFRPSVLVTSTKQSRSYSSFMIANKSIADIEEWDLRMIYSDSY